MGFFSGNVAIGKLFLGKKGTKILQDKGEQFESKRGEIEIRCWEKILCQEGGGTGCPEKL